MEYVMPRKVNNNTWSWKIGNKNATGRWQSRMFFNYSRFHGLCFLIEPSETNSDHGKLYLCEKTEGDLNTYDLHFVLEYKDETKVFSVENIKSSRRGKWNLYFVAEIRTSNLLEVTCKFLNMKPLNETLQESNETETNNQQEVKAKEAEKEEEKFYAELLNKGLNALSDSLKDAFLSENDSDVIIKVGSQNYPAHKIIIRNRSPVFRAMLEHDMKEKNESVISISDCDPDIFRDFLFYLYTAKLDHISTENAFELYHISDKYDVKELRETCEKFLIKNMSVDIICDVLSIALKHNELNMLTHATEFFVRNAKAVLETVNWQIFLKKYPVQANELFLKTLNKLSK